MNGKLYWKNKLPFILTNLFFMILMTLFLLACGNAVAVVEMILIVRVLILMAGMGIAYRNRKKELQKLLTMAEGLQERYLIQEVMRLPERADDQVYYQLMKMAGKSMLEQIGEVRRERLEYKKYI